MSAGVPWLHLHSMRAFKVALELLQLLQCFRCALLLLNPHPRLVELTLIFVHCFTSLVKMAFSDADNEARYQHGHRSHD
jgi:hypothetical protein